MDINERMSLKVGDCIVEFNGKEIKEGSELTSAVSKLKAGTKVKVKIIRDGKEQTIEVTLGEKTADSSSNNSQNNKSREYYYGGNGSDNFFGIG